MGNWNADDVTVTMSNIHITDLNDVGNVTVAALQFCQCTFSADLHLLVTTKSTRLNRGNAVAISYTWGEFNRRDVVLGHDELGTAIKMQLGQEWKTEEVIVTLASVCLEESNCGTCWIDQLCIPQDQPDVVRRVVSQIPSIYRTFDVIALMPGQPCKCLGEALSMAIAMQEVNDGHQGRLAADNMHGKLYACANSIGMSSYLDRVWTRQELMYSRNVKSLWTGGSIPLCVLDEAQTEELSSFSSLALARYKAAGLPHHLAFNALKMNNAYFLSNCYKAVSDYAGLAYATGLNKSTPVVALQFLVGHKIENGSPLLPSEDTEAGFGRFVEQVGRLGGTRRTATKPHDYVASVWVDCPGYILPVEYRTMGLPNLLEDAIRQFETLSGQSIPVNFPSDLTCGASAESALWRPASYLSTHHISSVEKVYGVLSQPFRPIPINNNGQMPLYMFHGRSVAIGSRAGEYSSVFQGQNASQAFDKMIKIVHQWPLAVLERLVNHNAERVARAGFSRRLPPSVEDLYNVFSSYLLESVMKKWGRVGSERSWQQMPNFDHHAAVYAMVVRALNLDQDACKFYGLRLLVSLVDPPIIGLTNRDPHDFHVLDDADQLFRLDPHRTITVCVSRGTQNTGDSLYDAVRISDGPQPTYRVTTVWVPQHNTPLHDIGATVDPNGHDGFLGARAFRECQLGTQKINAEKR